MVADKDLDFGPSSMYKTGVIYVSSLARFENVIFS